MEANKVNKLRELSFEIIQTCPNKCIYCSSNSTIGSKQMIDFSTFKKVIDDAIELGLKLLCFSGGEPFLHPELTNMVSYAKRFNLEVFIYTSGIARLEDGQFGPINKDILSKLRALNVDKLIFNMQADTDEVYNKIMGTEGMFPVLKESIKRANKENIYTEAHFVPMKINYKRIYPLLDLLDNLNVNKVSFLRFVPQGRAIMHSELLNLTDIEEQEVKQVLESLGSKYKSVEIRTGIPLTGHHEDKKCNAGRGKLIIKYDGTVYPCEAYKYIKSINRGKEVFPDNILIKRLSSIWNNSEFLKILVDYMMEFECNEVNCETCAAQGLLKVCKNNTIRDNEVLKECLYS